MKLLQELTEDIQIISEAKDDKKNLYIEGVFMQCVPNRNGRIYPESVMHKEVNRYIKEMVDTGGAVGELSHPNHCNLDPDRISHKIEKLVIEGKNIMGKAKILNTTTGRTAAGLIEGGVRVGVSSRGLGTLQELDNGLKEVQSDFKLITAADIVMSPSAPDAFVTGIMEGVDWFWDDKSQSWKQSIVAEETKKTIKKMTLKEIEENKLRLLHKYLKSIT